MGILNFLINGKGKKKIERNLEKETKIDWTNWQRLLENNEKEKITERGSSFIEKPINYKINAKWRFIFK